MKQSTRFWYYGSKDLGTLQYFLDTLIEKGYTIVSITPIEFDTVTISKTHYQVIKAIILIAK